MGKIMSICLKKSARRAINSYLLLDGQPFDLSDKPFEPDESIINPSDN
jgi:hypothetical protein